MISRALGFCDTDLPAGPCLEIGCGVGRWTYYLAELFDEVIATEISPGNLELCRQRTSPFAERIRHVLITDLADFDDLGPFSFVLTELVLQHNPPPVMTYILESVLSQLSPGGLAVFQVPIFATNYQFDADSFMKSEKAQMDMHVLPLEHVQTILIRNNMRIKSISLDGAAGPGRISASFVALKNEQKSRDIAR